MQPFRFKAQQKMTLVISQVYNIQWFPTIFIFTNGFQWCW